MNRPGCLRCGRSAGDTAWTSPAYAWGRQVDFNLPRILAWGELEDWPPQYIPVELYPGWIDD